MGSSGSKGEKTIMWEISATRDRLAVVDYPQPMKGFVCWFGEKDESFPASMEFITLPLRKLMKSMTKFAFESELEPILEAIAARKRQAILRVTLDTPGEPTGVPSFLQKSTPFYEYEEHGGGRCPKYSHKPLIDACTAFIQALGKAYDGDRRLAFIEAGLLGFWGEWHTYPHIAWFATDGVQKRIVDSFSDSFARTHVLLRKPVLDSVKLRFGYHDDMFPTETLDEEPFHFLPSIFAAGAQKVWTRCPIGGEITPPVQPTIFSESPPDRCDESRITEATKRTHISWAQCNYVYSHFNEFSSGSPTGTKARQIAAKLGYDFYISSVSCGYGGRGSVSGDQISSGMCACGAGKKPRIVESSPKPECLEAIQIEVVIHNGGVAPFYYPLFLELCSMDQTKANEEPISCIFEITEQINNTNQHPYSSDYRNLQSVLMPENIKLAHYVTGKSVKLRTSVQGGDYYLHFHREENDTDIFEGKIRLQSPMLVDGQTIAFGNSGIDGEGALIIRSSSLSGDS